MDIQNVVILVGLFIFIYLVCKKLNLFLENTGYSDHKTLGISNNSLDRSIAL